MAGLGLLLAIGQYSLINLHYVLWLLPGLSGLRAPGRFTVLVVLAGAMLAAFGLAWLQQQASSASPRATRWLKPVLVLTAGVAVGVLAVRLLLLVWPEAAYNAIGAVYLALPRDSYPLTASDVYAGLEWATNPSNPRLLIGLAGLALVSFALLVWQRGRASIRTWHGWPLVFVGLTTFDLLIFAWGVHPRAQVQDLGAAENVAAVLQRLVGEHDAPVRILASPVLNQVASDQLAPYAIQDANGYSSLQFIWHRDYLTRVLEVDDDLLDAWNIRYVLDPARFGSTPTYQGVTFLPSQRLLQGPAGSALAEETFAVQPDSTVREVRLVTALVGAVDLPQGTPVGEIELHGASGEILGRASLLAGLRQHGVGVRCTQRAALAAPLASGDGRRALRKRGSQRPAAAVVRGAPVWLDAWRREPDDSSNPAARRAHGLRRGGCQTPRATCSSSSDARRPSSARCTRTRRSASSKTPPPCRERSWSTAPAGRRRSAPR